MGWNYKAPVREEWMTDEEYEEAIEAYENALDDYADAYQEEHYGRKYGDR